jgi:hypothetical protein
VKKSQSAFISDLSASLKMTLILFKNDLAILQLENSISSIIGFIIKMNLFVLFFDLHIVPLMVASFFSIKVHFRQVVLGS